MRRVLERVAAERGRPEAILSDNGPEFQSRAVEAWALEAKVRRDFIEPGKPVQNAFIESFKRTLPRGMFEHALVHQLGRRPRQDRGLARGLQHRTAA